MIKISDQTPSLKGLLYLCDDKTFETNYSERRLLFV